MSVLKYHQQTPRYTSYPTAPFWGEISSMQCSDALQKIGDEPLSLYFHIPFCKTMCLFCGCSVILNRKEENESAYVEFLKKEIALVSSCLGSRKKVLQLHFGGGTPTKLSSPLLTTLLETISEHFEVDFSGEIAIEVDPRTVFEDGGEKLHDLRKLGFNRVSFGVQDTNLKVQEAIKRHQSYEMTKTTFFLAKQLQFQGINVDLIYGLPYQNKESFTQTVEEILMLRPDRIALFSYAKIPWLKKHQKAIAEEWLPSTEEKFAIYENARKAFIDSGYIAIGMDHFALPHDELAISYKNKTLQRNFQGYTVKRADTTLGFGVTAIGFAQNMYMQNHKELKSYYEALEKNILPVLRGKALTAQDCLRKWVIHTLMCHFELDKAQFSEKFKEDFDLYFTTLSAHLYKLEEEGLITNTKIALKVTPLGELFVRNIAVIFDAYLPEQTQKFSYSI